MKIKNKNIVFLSFLLYTLSFILVQGCSPIEPDKDNKSAPTDTTSHNFTFETWKFGEHSSSILYDVAIIDENNIYAVGEIYMNDSLGQADPTPYNALHWDGNRWDIMRIPTKTFAGTMVSSSIKTIFSFGENDIWTFSIAGSYSHWNGSNWKTEFVNERQGSGNKLWGTSSSNLYLVCNSGGISFYNGASWQKIDSGTELDIYDIWGYKTTSGQYEILCIASDKYTNKGKKILKLENNKVTSINSEGLSNSLNSVWFVSDKKYFVGGDGLFSTQNLNTNWIKNTELPAYYKTSVRGNDTNDIIISGAFGLLLHYNGKSWINFQNLTYINGAFARVDIQGNILCAVGSSDNQAVIIMGKR